MTGTLKHAGTAFDDFLREADVYEETASIAAARVLAWQIEQEMQAQGLTKVEMARRMGTSRSQLDRLLKPDGAGLTLDTLYRAAQAVNRRIHLELV